MTFNLNDWVDEATADGAAPLEIAGAVGSAIADGLGAGPDACMELLGSDSDLEVPVDLEFTIWDLGRAYELSLDAKRRRAEGIHYTPPRVARGLAALAIGSDVEACVCDPAVGTGAFLLAAGMHLEAIGVDRRTVVEERLWGVDLDADAIEVARATLALWALESGEWFVPIDRFVVADTLELGFAAFPGRDDRFDVVVGNPPFQSQLAAASARLPDQTQSLRERWGVDVDAYADTAAFFLLAALELVRPGGTVGLIQPRSVLASASVEPVRRAVGELGLLTGLWIGNRDVFAADVEVCAPFIVRGPGDRGSEAVVGSDGSSMVQRWEGEEVDPRPPIRVMPDASSWAPLVADLGGVPLVDLANPVPLSSMATATAGFRDEFYGLAAAAKDDPDGAGHPLITVGMIDPLRNRWGTTKFRLAGREVCAPRVALDDLDDEPRLRQWVGDRLVPKVLVGTQTKVIEVVVDEVGDLVPCTPVVAVAAPADRLWHIASVLSSPVVSAVALARVGGSALSSDTIKLSARQVLELPVPASGPAWDRAAILAREAAAALDEEIWRSKMVAMAQEMQRAFGVDDETLLEWWEQRLPNWR